MRNEHVDKRVDRVFRPAGLAPADLQHFLDLGRRARARAFTGMARAGLAALKGVARR